jgi:thymidine phosphorylase
LEKAPVIRPIYGDGFIVEMNTRAVGNALIELGGGRRVVGEALNLSVGFSEVAPMGTELGKERPMAIVHAASEADADLATQNLRNACKTAAKAPAERPVIYEVMTG